MTFLSEVWAGKPPYLKVTYLSVRETPFVPVALFAAFVVCFVLAFAPSTLYFSLHCSIYKKVCGAVLVFPVDRKIPAAFRSDRDSYI